MSQLNLLSRGDHLRSAPTKPFLPRPNCVAFLLAEREVELALSVLLF